MFSSREHLDKKTGPYGIGRFSYLQSLVTEFQDTDSENPRKNNWADLAESRQEQARAQGTLLNHQSAVKEYLTFALDYQIDTMAPSVTDMCLYDHFISFDTADGASGDHASAKEEVLANLANFAYDPVNYEFLRTLNVIGLFLDCLTENKEKCVQFALGGICNLALDKQNKEYILKNNGVNLVIDCLSSSNEETVLNAVTTLMFLVTPKSKADITALQVIDVMLRFKSSSNTRLSNLATVFLEDYCSDAQINEAIQAQEEWEEDETTGTQVPELTQEQSLESCQ